MSADTGLVQREGGSGDVDVVETSGGDAVWETAQSEPDEQFPPEDPIPDEAAERCGDGVGEPAAVNVHWLGFEDSLGGDSVIEGHVLSVKVDLEYLPNEVGSASLHVTALADDGCEPMVTAELGVLKLGPGESGVLTIDLEQLGVWNSDMHFAGAVGLSIGVADAQEGEIFYRVVTPSIYFFGKGNVTHLVGEVALWQKYGAGWLDGPAKVDGLDDGTAAQRIFGPSKTGQGPQPPTEDDADALALALADAQAQQEGMTK